MSTRAKSICLFSPKGGVGKTIIAMNLAGILSKKGNKVLLIDLDVFNGGLSLLINDNITKTIYQLTDDLNNNRFKEFKEYVNKYNDNIDILCAPKDPRQGSKIDSKYIDIIIEKASLFYDEIIIDTSSVFDEINLVTLDIVDEIFFVTTNDMMSLKNLRNILNIFKDNGIDNYKVILNNSFDYRIPYFSLLEMKKIIGANIDYSLSTSYFIKDITRLLYECKIPVLDSSTSKKSKNEFAKLEQLLSNYDVKGSDNNEKK